MNSTASTSIHRFLDQAFAGVELTPDAQDLKEELRGNLAARVDELEKSGVAPEKAATAAIRELGDITPLIHEVGESGSATAAELNRVRPQPAFVASAVILSLILAAAVTLVALGALAIVQHPLALGAAIVGAIAVGALVDYSLRQETSQHYRVPSGRAVLFGVTSIVGFAGLSFLALWFGEPGSLWLVVAGGLAAVVALVGFIALGVTQTNRMKPWALQQQRDYVASDPFTKDPAAAARFGIYTVVIWTVAIALFVVLSIAVGFAWSWLAIVAGLVVFFLTLARMLFAAKKES